MAKCHYILANQNIEIKLNALNRAQVKVCSCGTLVDKALGRLHAKPMQLVQLRTRNKRWCYRSQVKRIVALTLA